MGGGTYCCSSREIRASASGYYTKSAGEIFKQRSINNAMDPKGVTLRESRDSEEHPNSVPIIIALDVTGSMGTVPHHLVKDGLPTMMKQVIEAGVPDPQVLFLAVGDHECDSYPLQVGQFESSDELLDKWLTTVYLEGGGGGNDGESYFLAHYFAGRYCETDAWDKRKQKGFLFTIGDEPNLKDIDKHAQEKIMGDGQYSKTSSADILAKAQEKFNVYHIHIRETGAGARQATIDGWKQLLGDNLIVAQSKNKVPEIIAEIVANASKQAVANKAKPIKESKTKPEQVEVL